MKNFKLFLFLFMIGSVTGVNAQDFLKTQYQRAPLSLNPALTGLFDGKLRVISGYRNQKSSVLRRDAYNAFGLNADARIPTKKGNAIGVGIMGRHDNQGQLTTTNFKLSVAYHLKIGVSDNADHNLSIGANYGYGILVYTTDSPGQVVGESSYQDVGLGVAWRTTFAQNQGFYLGVSAAHLNEPEVTFENIFLYCPLPVRYVFHAGGELSVRNNFALLPQFYIQAVSGAQRILPSLAFKKYFGASSAFYSIQLGVMTQLVGDNDNRYDMQSMSIMAQLDHSNFSFGFSYDHSLSKFQRVHRLSSAFEITLGYVVGDRKDAAMSELP